jgi:hypothetical protein
MRTGSYPLFATQGIIHSLTCVPSFSRRYFHENLFFNLIVAALDLVHHPENITTKAVVLHVKLRPHAESLWLPTRFEIVTGIVAPMAAVEELTKRGGASEQTEGYKRNHERQVSLGDIGLAMLMFISSEPKGTIRLQVKVGDTESVKLTADECPEWNDSNWVFKMVVSFHNFRINCVALSSQLEKVKPLLENRYQTHITNSQ